MVHNRAIGGFSIEFSQAHSFCWKGWTEKKKNKQTNIYTQIYLLTTECKRKKNTLAKFGYKYDKI